MSDNTSTEETGLIKAPLWDLMLATNDCYPGCGCGDDFFDMALDRVKKWVITHEKLKTIQQIDQLLSNDNIDVGDIQIQTNIPFQSDEEFREWLLEWKKLIIESI